MDALSLILTVGGCFLFAATLVTVAAFIHAPMGRETEDGFIEEPSPSHAKAPSTNSLPGVTLHLPQ